MAKKTDKPASGRGGGRRVQPDESDLFRAAVGDAKKLDGAAPPAPPAGDGRDDAPAKPKTRRVRRAKSVPPAPPAPPVPPAPRPDLPELRSGAAAGVDGRTMERLRRGRLRPEGRLDLHGRTQAEAHDALSAFLSSSRQQGKRCVIVITGKGRISEGGGILRNQVPRWLNQPEFRPHILGFSAAQPKDGGGGALYVLLKRAR